MLVTKEVYRLITEVAIEVIINVGNVELTI